jgi:hypothetical protein
LSYLYTQIKVDKYDFVITIYKLADILGKFCNVKKPKPRKMKDYIFRENNEFDANRFNQEINKAISIITENEGLEENAFNKIRHSLDLSYTINGLHYQVELISYEIKKDNLIIGRLDCFKDIKNKYIEISLIPNY